MTAKILVVDDDKAIRDAIRLILESEPYEMIEAANLDDAFELVIKQEPDMVFLDVHFPGGTCHSLLRRLAAESLTMPVVILSGAATGKEAAEAIKLGAYDFMEKPISASRLRLTLTRTLEYGSLRKMVSSLGTVADRGLELIGVSPAMQAVRRQVEQFGPRDVKVLVTGETGVGKEVVAQGLWRQSERQHKPFVVVNAAAVPENLIESELFGHKKGAFTGAVSDQLGKIEMAHGGTLFLDEVGDLSLAAQTKLLRFLENNEIQAVGSHKIRQVDVRLIAATSRDLEEDMKGGRFRPDLFYRLNVVRIVVPSLRDRREDVPALFMFFVKNFCKKFDLGLKEIEGEVFQRLQEVDWPGNVRELRNTAERAVLLAKERILVDHLQGLAKGGGAAVAAEDDVLLTLKDFKAKTEKAYLEKVLAKAGSITQAAYILGIDRSYLHQKMNQHGIQRQT